MNLLTRQAAEAVVGADFKGARTLLIQAVREDRHDPFAWLLLAVVLGNEEERAKALERVERLGIAPPPSLPPPDSVEPLEVPVMAVNKQHFPAAVSQLALREVLQLRREPHNPFDPNAIQVIRQNGQPCGYLGRRLAAELAPALDDQPLQLTATVTALSCNYYDDTLSLRVTLQLPPALRARARATLDDHTHPLAFFFDATSHYTYLMIDSTERRFHEAKQGLASLGLADPTTGISFRPSSNGRSYRWFIRLDSGAGVSQEAIEQYFLQQYDLVSDNERARRQQEEERRSRANRQLLEAENNRLLKRLTETESEREGLLGELEEARGDVDYSNEIVQAYSSGERDLKNRLLHKENEIASLKAQLEENERQSQEAERAEARERAAAQADDPAVRDVQALIQCLLPQVSWCRACLDVLTLEFQNMLPTLRLLFRLHHEPPEAIRSSKRVRSASEWWEEHVSTGQGDDGRLYYRREGSKLHVLLSYKRYQDADIAWLRSQSVTG